MNNLNTKSLELAKYFQDIIDKNEIDILELHLGKNRIIYLANSWSITNAYYDKLNFGSNIVKMEFKNRNSRIVFNWFNNLNSTRVLHLETPEELIHFGPVNETPKDKINMRNIIQLSILHPKFINFDFKNDPEERNFLDHEHYEINRNLFPYIEIFL
jgi:hypothetical protein